LDTFRVLDGPEKLETSDQADAWKSSCTALKLTIRLVLEMLAPDRRLLSLILERWRNCPELHSSLISSSGTASVDSVRQRSIEKHIMAKTGSFIQEILIYGAIHPKLC
jgi:hypothetical protein